SATTIVAKIFQRSALRTSAAKPASMPTPATSQPLSSSSAVATLPAENVGAISPIATTAISNQYQWARRGQRSSVSGRHSAASATRIGYSAIQENSKGAMSPAKSPPTMPPNDSAT